ncbi:hypothetical protein [Cellulomonas sp. S1-8]|uniref:hypothetical protein n=1 Tax=Cellulomonas sp. S1-8 TaxID=2904790 RepID=UPI0022437E2C|nr:hypothetical protein [Cellulomonas sp. S1-8]UZN02667.1 DUF3137 domain-containing protein [Cellulomonas sp. S1-8]
MRRGVQVGAVVVLGLVGTGVAGAHVPGGGSFGVAVVLGLVVLVAVGVGGRWLHQQRQQQLAAWASAAGWTYAPRDPGIGLATLQSGRPFGQGHSRSVTEVLTGAYEDLPAVSFTYGWTTGSGKEERDHRAHVVGVPLPAYLPTLELTAEGVGARLAKTLGARDLQLESEAFNAAYRVDAADPRTAHAILHPRTLERLLRPDAVGLAWRVEGTWLQSWEPGSTDTARIAPRLGVLSGVVRGVPRHVWQDHGYDPVVDGPPGARASRWAPWAPPPPQV